MPTYAVLHQMEIIVQHKRFWSMIWHTDEPDWMRTLVWYKQKLQSSIQKVFGSIKVHLYIKIWPNVFCFFFSSLFFSLKVKFLAIKTFLSSFYDKRTWQRRHLSNLGSLRFQHVLFNKFNFKSSTYQWIYT